ncbi:nucleotidyl transferase AbiEii/AbiGii toxin family protein [Nocardia mangyaensis]|uniref:nucleotidyl transferase AbiEii/AbiGii toxin family protein n=1 Tax=Nocardia mangyaensis TaxID=2213200 RepID=UPI003B82E92B
MLARVFVDPFGPWILKGGTSLLVRIPGARHSQDLDLLHPDAAAEVYPDVGRQSAPAFPDRSDSR